MEYTAILIMQEGKWKIKDLPYPFMHWDWVNQTIEGKALPSS
jgi:hypothetical protein